MPIAVIGVVLLAMPHASLVGHVPQTNWSNMDSRLSLRAQQTILANEWWCAQPEPGRNASLACRRYTLRRLYAASAESQARTEVRMQISEMVMDASEATLSAMRVDVNSSLPLAYLVVRSPCVSFRCAWLRLLLELLPLPAHQYLIRGLAAICHAPPLEGAAAGARRAAR